MSKDDEKLDRFVTDICAVIRKHEEITVVEVVGILMKIIHELCEDKKCPC